MGNYIFKERSYLKRRKRESRKEECIYKEPKASESMLKGKTEYKLEKKLGFSRFIATILWIMIMLVTLKPSRIVQ
jgi:hypothetical protein